MTGPRWCPPSLRTPEWNAWEAALSRFYASHPVYFVQHGAGGLIKIGWSENIEKRMSVLQSMAPLPLILLGWRLGGRTEERRLHVLFDDSKAWSEWFRPTEDLLTYIATETTLSGPAPKPIPYPQTEEDAKTVSLRRRRAELAAAKLAGRKAS